MKKLIVLLIALIVSANVVAQQFSSEECATFNKLTEAAINAYNAGAERHVMLDIISNSNMSEKHRVFSKTIVIFVYSVNEDGGMIGNQQRNNMLYVINQSCLSV